MQQRIVPYPPILLSPNPPFLPSPYRYQGWQSKCKNDFNFTSVDQLASFSERLTPMPAIPRSALLIVLQVIFDRVRRLWTETYISVSA